MQPLPQVIFNFFVFKSVAFQCGNQLGLKKACTEGIYVKRDHCTALRAMQHPSMTPTSLLGVWGGE